MEYADIFIIGDIGEQVKLVDVVTQVRKQPLAVGYNVHINSVGGYVDTGFQIHDYLKSLEKPVHTIGEGMVASIATVIHAAGDKRTITPNTEYMIHLPMGGIENGTADEIDKYGEQVKSVENKILKFYTDMTGNTKEAILPLLQEETWLDEDQLLSLGFITERSQRIAAKAILNTNSKKMDAKEEKEDGAIMKAIAKLLKGVVKSEVTAQKVVFTAEQKELIFDALEETSEVSIGDMATIDGQPAEGEIVLSDGKILIFSAGAVTDIMEEEIEADEEMTKRIAELEEQLEGHAKELNTVKAKLQKAEEQNNKNLEVIKGIEKIRSEFSAKKKDAPKKDEEKVSRVSVALANRKQNVN